VDLRIPRSLTKGGDPMTTQTLSTPPGTTAGSTARTTRIGAGFGLASVVALMAGFALVASADAVHTSPSESIVGFYSDPDQSLTYAGGLISCVGLLMLLPFVATVAGRAGDLSGTTARMAGAAYVVLCLPSQAAGAAALWLGAHDGDASSIVALNALRAFTYYTALLALAGFLVAVGIGGRTTGRLAPWMAWSGIATGTVLAIGVAGAQTGLADLASLIAIAWIVAVSVGLLRSPERGNDPVGGR
jgi:hypothetical protein